MKKRFLSILLAMLMVLSTVTVLPITASAESTTYAITNGTPESAKETNHGYITVDETAAEGETVTITVKPNEGYQLKSLTVTPAVDKASYTIKEKATWFSAFSGTTTDKTKITDVVFGKSLPQGVNEQDGVDLTASGTGKVKGYIVANGDNYKIYIVGDYIFGNASCQVMFSGFKNLTTLDFGNFDTSNVTDMTGMFYQCSSLTTLNLSNFDTSSVTNMSNMFAMCSNLISLDLSKFDTSSVTNMSNMFFKCLSLTSLDLSKFNTGKVTNKNDMFQNCAKLASVKIEAANDTIKGQLGNMWAYASGVYTAQAPAVPLTIEFILGTVSDDFPTAADNKDAPDGAWKTTDTNKTCYKWSNEIVFNNQTMFTRGYERSGVANKSEDGYIYTYSDNTITFIMTDGVLTSIKHDGPEGDGTNYNGTYTAPATKTVADILPGEFPEEWNDGWKNSSNEDSRLYVNEGKLVAKYPHEDYPNALINLDIDSKLTPEDNNYSYTNDGIKWTFNMSGEAFGSVTISGASGDNSVLNGTYSPVSQCIAAGTMISMPEGNQKAVEELEIGDVINTFDHETGEVSSAPVAFIWESKNVGNAFTLTFEGDVEVTVIEEHGFYDQEEQKYVFINLQNAEEYIGDQFYNADTNSWLALKNCEALNESIDAYAIITSGDLNHMSNGMLSMCDGSVKVLANIFEYDNQMKFDADKKKADIEAYGLTPKEKILELEGFIESDYDDYHLQYLNVAIGKGLTTWEWIEALSDYCVENGLVDIYSGSETAEKNEAPKMLLMSATAPKTLLGSTPEPTPQDGIEIKANENGTYTFAMPAANVTVTAEFEEKAITIADILPDDFPTCVDVLPPNLWVNGNEVNMMVIPYSLVIFTLDGDGNPDYVTLADDIRTATLTESGNNYTYTNNGVTTTFLMSDNGLESVKIEGLTGEYVDFNGTYGEQHAHSFTYTANNGKITATCVEGCDDGYDTNPLTLTLTAPASLVYDGNAKAFTFADGEAAAWTGAGLELPTITYYQKYSGQGWYTQLNEVPANAGGDYMAEIVANNKAAQVKFTIDKKTGKGATDKLVHTVTPVSGKTATQTEPGFKAYYKCKNCGKYYEDAEEKVVITDLSAWKAKGGNGYIPSGDEIEAAETSAKAALDTENAKDALLDETALTNGKSAIDNAETLADIETAKNNAVTAIKQAQASELEAAKTNAKAALDNENAKDLLSDATTVNNGKNAIDAAKTKADVEKAKNDAITAIKAAQKASDDPVDITIEGGDVTDVVLKVEVVVKADAVISEDHKAIVDYKELAEKKEVVAGVYEVRLLLNGEEIQPDELGSGTVVTVRMLIPEDLIGKEFRLVHVHAADDVQTIVQGEEAGVGTYVIDDDGYLVTKIDRFSEFVFLRQDTSVSLWWLWILIALIVIGGAGTTYYFVRKKKKNQ